jgi:hypothetical protein
MVEKLKAPNGSPAQQTRHKVGIPIPVKLTADQEGKLCKLQQDTRINRSVLLRLSYYYFIKQVSAGRLDVFKLLEEYSKNNVI